MIAKLIMAGVVVLALMGAIVSFVHGQREIGRADERAKQAEAQAEHEALLAEAAEQAREDAVRTLAALQKRHAEARRQLELNALSREAANERQAKTDPIYADWRYRPLPAYVIAGHADGVRAATADPGNTSSRSVSRGDGIPAGSTATGSAPHERGTR